MQEGRCLGWSSSRLRSESKSPRTWTGFLRVGWSDFSRSRIRRRKTGMTKQAKDVVFDERVAFVTELGVEDEPGRFSGLFAAHWEARSGEAWLQGPEAVAVDEAIAWARECAPFVSVLIGGREPVFSAGTRQLTGVSPWPAAGLVVRERPIGEPPGGGVDEIPWRVESVATAVPDVSEAALARITAALDESSCLLDASVTRAGPSAVRLRCQCRARNMNASTLAVDALMERVLRAQFASLEAQEFLDIRTSTLGPSGL